MAVWIPFNKKSYPAFDVFYSFFLNVINQCKKKKKRCVVFKIPTGFCLYSAALIQASRTEVEPCSDTTESNGWIPSSVTQLCRGLVGSRSFDSGELETGCIEKLDWGCRLLA